MKGDNIEPRDFGFIAGNVRAQRGTGIWEFNFMSPIQKEISWKLNLGIFLNSNIRPWVAGQNKGTLSLQLF